MQAVFHVEKVRPSYRFTESLSSKFFFTVLHHKYSRKLRQSLDANSWFAKLKPVQFFWYTHHGSAESQCENSNPAMFIFVLTISLCVCILVYKFSTKYDIQPSFYPLGLNKLCFSFCDAHRVHVGIKFSELNLQWFRVDSKLEWFQD